MLCSAWASLVVQMVKNLPAMQDAWVQSLGWKDLLENYPLCILACETIYHRLGLKPNQNPQYLVSGPNEAQVLDVSSQKEFSEKQNDR